MRRGRSASRVGRILFGAFNDNFNLSGKDGTGYTLDIAAVNITPAHVP